MTVSREVRSLCKAETRESKATPFDWELRYCGYRGTSLTRKRTLLGLYRRPMPRVLGGSLGGWRFLIGEVPLQEGNFDSTEGGDPVQVGVGAPGRMPPTLTIRPDRPISDLRFTLTDSSGGLPTT